MKLAKKTVEGKKPDVKSGGSHKDMQKPEGDGKDFHHIPDRKADPSVDPKDGTAIKMDPKDHKKTSSCGKGGKKYTKENAEMIKDGRKRDVYTREIKDARNAAQKGSGDRRKYNKGIKEMLDYGKKSGQVPPKK
jgi:filamentous hemagglutinin